MASLNIFINSKNRTSGDFNNFTLNVNNNFPFFALKPEEQLMIYPTRLSILNDFYNINEYNNVFIVQEINNLGQVVQEIDIDTIPEGYYNVFNFATQLENNLALLLNNDIADDFSVVVDYLQEENIYEIQIINENYFNSGNTLRFKFNNVASTLAQFLGFEEGIYEMSGIVLNGQKIKSKKPLNFLFQPEIHCYCNLVRNNLETTETGMINSNLLFTFSQNVSKNEYIIFVNPHKLYLTECLDKFSEIQISFKDSLGRDINFLSDCQIVLSFEKISIKTNDEKILKSLEDGNRLKELSILGQQLQMSQKNNIS